MTLTPHQNVSTQTPNRKPERNRKSAPRPQSALLGWLIQCSLLSIICPFISERLVGHQSDCFVSIPAFIYAALKVANVCIVLILGGAVRYEGSRLNPSALRNMSCHRGTAPSSSAGHMYYRSAGVMTRLAFLLLRLFIYVPPPHFVLPLAHQSNLLSSFIEIEVLITA